MSTTTKPTRKEQAAAVRKAVLDNWRRSSDRQIAEMIESSNRTVSQARNALIAEGLILPRPESTQPGEACHHEVCTSAIKPAWLNNQLYAPIDESAPAFVALKNDIAANGLLEPIVVSGDGVILSGHRRFAAVRSLGISRVAVRIRFDVLYYRDLDKFLRLLASFNRQRPKTSLEQMREELVLASEESCSVVRTFQYESEQVSSDGEVELRERKPRSEIRDKMELKAAIINVVEAEEDNWPLSDRGIHYRLLNITGLVRNDKTRAPYLNDAASYDDVTGMLTRLRLDGSIPFDCIADETRGVTTWETHQCVGDFIRDQLNSLFVGYWRNLQQGQPNWLEILAEKNTIASQLKNIAGKYQVPMTSGRGYSSLPPRRDMVNRFKASGRKNLIVIVVSDFDPEGEDIPGSFGASLRDDFGVHESRLKIVKAGLTYKQVQTLNLHAGQVSKTSSSRYERFAEKYGPRCWELESLETEQLRQIVEASILGALHLPTFDAELAIQRKEQNDLKQRRNEARQALQAMWAEGGES